MKIIDSHVHVVKYITGFGSEGELYAIGDGLATYASGKTIRLIPEGLGDYSFTYETLISEMDKYNVERAVILQGHYLGLSNLYAYEAMKKYPNRLISACMFDPFSAKADLIKDNLFNNLGFKILKLECSNGSGLMSNHTPFSIDNEIMNQIYKLCSDKKITIVFDIGRPNSPSYQIDNLLNIVKRYKDVTFVICHLFACPSNSFGLFKSIIDKFKGIKNIYFDTASIMNNTKEEYPYNDAQKYIRYTIDTLGIDKVMWGTDIPSGVAKTDYKKCISYLMDSSLFTENEKEHIFYLNSRRVYFNEDF